MVQHLSDEVDLAAVLGKGIDNVPDVGTHHWLGSPAFHLHIAVGLQN